MTEYQVEVEHVLVTHEVVSAGTSQVAITDSGPVEVTVADAGVMGPQGPAGVTNLTQVSFTHLVVAPGDIPATGFNTVPFQGAPNVNIGGGTWNVGSSQYTVPLSGRYLITARLRIADDSPARSLGIGVHTSNGDGPWFTWRAVGTTAASNRDTVVYTRVDSFSANDQLRLYIYSEGVVFPPSAAALTIDRIGN